MFEETQKKRPWYSTWPVVIPLLVVVAVGVVGFYLAEKYWLSKKVEEASPETIHKIEQAAEDKLHEIRDEISDILPHPLSRHKDAQKQKDSKAATGDK